MWSIVEPASGKTNVVTVPADGIISIVKPMGVGISATVNNADAPLAHLHVKAGDSVYFCLSGAASEERVAFEYGGVTSYINVPAGTTTGDSIMDTNGLNLFANPASGGLAGAGAGVVGGLLAGALTGRGGVFGGQGGDGFGAVNTINQNTDARVASANALTQARFDAEAQREIQAAVERTAAATQLAGANQAAALGVSVVKGQGEINTQVALTSGALGVNVTKGQGDIMTQNALNAAALGVQVQKIGGDLATQVALNTAAVATAVDRVGTATALSFKDASLQASQLQGVTASQIRDDGDRTRALIITQYENTLNRQLATAQAEIIELRNHDHNNRRSRETEINVTQSVNQNQNNLQAQQQQQQQFQILANLAAQVGNLANDIQVVRQTQSNINFGVQGTAGQTATAANTRVN